MDKRTEPRPGAKKAASKARRLTDEQRQILSAGTAFPYCANPREINKWSWTVMAQWTVNVEKWLNRSGSASSKPDPTARIELSTTEGYATDGATSRGELSLTGE